MTNSYLRVWPYSEEQCVGLHDSRVACLEGRDFLHQQTPCLVFLSRKGGLTSRDVFLIGTWISVISHPARSEGSLKPRPTTGLSLITRPLGH